MGAEIVVGYVTLSEFAPPSRRGRWGAALAAITTSALFFSALGAFLVIPSFGWRWMFVITGVGALIVWRLRRDLPERACKVVGFVTLIATLGNFHCLVGNLDRAA